MSRIIFVGDLEGDFDKLIELDNDLKVRGHKTTIIQVGDLGLFDGVRAITQCKKYAKNARKVIQLQSVTIGIKTSGYNKLSNEVYAIKGNNEDFLNVFPSEKNRKRPDSEFIFLDQIKSLNVNLINDSKILNIEGKSIAFLGGIFSPKNFSSTEKSRQYFKRHDITNLITESRNNKVDILVTHQAPYGVLPKREEGCKKINWLLEELKPDLLVHGHHHYNYSTTYTCPGGHITRIRGLGNFSVNQNSVYYLDSN